MTLSDFIRDNRLLLEFPPIDFFQVLTNGKSKICWVDLDKLRKNSYFLMVNENNEITEQLSFKEFYHRIDDLINNGWYKAENSFIEIEEKAWLENFTEKYRIPLH